jgi:NADH:ubiquinone oxidoreductase subunit 6 (subunit J)
MIKRLLTMLIIIVFCAAILSAIIVGVAWLAWEGLKWGIREWDADPTPIIIIGAIFLLSMFIVTIVFAIADREDAKRVEEKAKAERKEEIMARLRHGGSLTDDEFEELLR